MKKIAVTGRLSSGKTTICHILQEYGAYQVSSDEIVHQLLSVNNSCIEKVVSLLGSEILTGHEIDRKKVAEIVFSDREKLEVLEKVLHPLVFEEIQKQYNRVKDDPRFSMFVVEIPLLFEIGAENLFDIVVTVTIDESLAKERSQINDAEYKMRSERQLSQEEKAKRANYIIANNESVEQLKENTIKFIEFIQKENVI